MPRVGQQTAQQPGWTYLKVSLAMSDDSRKPVLAQVFGHVAVYQGETSTGKHQWGIAHALTGLLLCHVGMEHDAKRIAEHLVRLCSVALATRDPDVAAALFPPPVRDWLKECRRTGRWCEPREDLCQN